MVGGNGLRRADVFEVHQNALLFKGWRRGAGVLLRI
jgi:hypothetical protein